MRASKEVASQSALEEGLGVEADPARAVELYRECAEADPARFPSHSKDSEEASRDLGIYNLARCYVSGTGTEKDVVKAFELMHKLAERGNTEGMYNLGLMYQNGFGTEEDPESAYYWYRKAADLGYMDAQNNLAKCYYDGKGVEKKDRGL